MFTLALYDYLSTNIPTINGVAVNWGYSDIADGVSQPYIIQYKLDNNPSRQLLCDEFNASGVDFLQWNIFTDKADLSDNIAFELEKVLDDLWVNNTSLTYGTNSYTIKLREHNSSPSAQDFANDLAPSVLANTFYYKEGE